MARRKLTPEQKARAEAGQAGEGLKPGEFISKGKTKVTVRGGVDVTPEKEKEKVIKLGEPKKEEVIKLGKKEEPQDWFARRQREARALREETRAEYAAMSPGEKAKIAITSAAILGVAVGSAYLGPAIVGKLAGTGKATAVSKAATIGSRGIPSYLKGAAQISRGITQAISGPAIAQFATNTATLATSVSLLTKVGLVLGGASLLVGAIGSYPFAGFIEEEALQTLSFGVRSAIANNDIEGAESALDMQEEILNPEMWDRIIAKIPYANVVAKLNRFKEAAALKVSIDREVINQMKIQKDTGETEAEKWARIEKERDEKRELQRQADEEYFAEIQRQNKKAKKEQREIDEAYWDKILADRKQREKEEREAEEKYWEEVRKESSRLREEMSPSNLDFGLI